MTQKAPGVHRADVQSHRETFSPLTPLLLGISLPLCLSVTQPRISSQAADSKPTSNSRELKLILF